MQKIKATIHDLHNAALNLSTGDRADLEAMQVGRNPIEVFERALDETTYAIKIDEQVLAVGGHSNGCIWFVTTTVVDALPLAQRFRFFRMLKEHLAFIRKASPNLSLTNWVSVENKAHTRLLEALKARFQEGFSLSPAGNPFKQFWL